MGRLGAALVVGRTGLRARCGTLLVVVVVKAVGG